MEDIKTSLDKMLAKFNDSVTHSAPKKLSFENMNDSLNDSGTSEYTKNRYFDVLHENSMYMHILNK